MPIRVSSTLPHAADRIARGDPRRANGRIHVVTEFIGWPGVPVAALGAVLTMGTLLWLLSLRLKDASIVDTFWGPFFLLQAAIYAALLPGGFQPRTAVGYSLATGHTRLARRLAAATLVGRCESSRKRRDDERAAIDRPGIAEQVAAQEVVRGLDAQQPQHHGRQQGHGPSYAHQQGALPGGLPRGHGGHGAGHRPGDQAEDDVQHALRHQPRVELGARAEDGADDDVPGEAQHGGDGGQSGHEDRRAGDAAPWRRRRWCARRPVRR